jgi:LPS-assembly protein
MLGDFDNAGFYLNCCTNLERSVTFSKKCLLFLFLGCFCASAEDITFINSDSTQYTQEGILCEGNVIIIYYDHIISASSVNYNSKSEMIYASGNVIIKDKMQNVYFLDTLSVNKNFESGKGKNIKIIYANKSRLAATKCSIKDKKYILEDVVYTPCYECVVGNRLTWQAKALNAVFDPNQYTEYQNVKFEFLDTSIFYTPYLSHVSSKVKRKSGLLIPKFSTSTESGGSVLLQYFWAISNSQELILKPVITSKIGSVGWIYYGLRFPHGEFDLDTSIAGIRSVKEQPGAGEEEKRIIQKIKDSGYRGHIFSKLRYEIDNVWRCGFDINLVSDNYYVKRIPFFSQNLQNLWVGRMI